jgi:hypothetical protein
MTCGPVPVRSWEASSAKVVLRMWCSASMSSMTSVSRVIMRESACCYAKPQDPMG